MQVIKMNKLTALIAGIIAVALAVYFLSQPATQPVEEKAFQYNVVKLVTVNDKPAYLAEENNKEFIIYDGKEIGRDYDSIDTSTIQDVAGRLTFLASKNGKRIIYHGGQELGNNYDIVETIEENGQYPFKEVNGKLAFAAGKGHRKIIVYDGQEFGNEYDTIDPAFYADVGGKLTFVAERLLEKFIVYGNKQVGQAYDSIDSLGAVDGRLSFTAKKGNLTIIALENSKGELQFLQADYDAQQLTPVGGRLAYIGRTHAEPALNFGPEAEPGGERFVVYDGAELAREGRDYDLIEDYSLQDIGGKLAFTALKNGKRVIVYDGKEIGENYDNVYSVKAINGRLAFAAVKAGKGIIVYDGQEQGTSYSAVDTSAFKEVNHRLTYLADKGTQRILVYGEEEIGLAYDSVDAFAEVDGKLVYTAKKGNEVISVTVT